MEEKRILVSVSDKQGLMELIEFLNLKYKKIRILASQGTYKYLREIILNKEIVIESIEEYIGFSEVLDGRVKTLNSKLYAGILFDREHQEHLDWIHQNKIFSIDFVIANLYPFHELFSYDRDSLSLKRIIDKIDIGGVSLLRAAAKNFPYVGVLSDPKDYSFFIESLGSSSNFQEKISKELYYELALRTFKRVSKYDEQIASFLKKNKTKILEFLTF